MSYPAKGKPDSRQVSSDAKNNNANNIPVTRQEYLSTAAFPRVFLQKMLGERPPSPDGKASRYRPRPALVMRE